jgi:hypothetical protein
MVEEVVLRVSGNVHERIEKFAREITEVNKVKLGSSDLVVEKVAADFN